MSIDDLDDMTGSEFDLSPEEQAELEKLEAAENEGDDDDVDPEFLDEMLKPNDEKDDGGTGSPTDEPNPDDQPGTDTPPSPNNNDTDPNDNPTDDEDAYQQHLANEQAVEAWQEKLDEATEAKTVVLDEIEALGKQLDDGEIGEGQYRAKIARLEDSLSDHKKAIAQAEQELVKAEQHQHSFAEQRQQAVNDAWQKEIADFVAENPAYDINGQDQRYVNRFNDVIKDLYAKEAFVGLNHKQIIEMVKFRVEVELGAPQKSATTQGGNKTTPKRESVNIPPTLDQMRTHEPNPTHEDEFISISRLSGTAYEDALAKLEKSDPEAYNRYMSQ